MRSPFTCPSAVRRMAPLIVLAVLVAILIIPAAAQAADTTTVSVAPVTTSAPTTVPAAGSGQTGTAVVPPPTGELALNPGLTTDQMEIRVMPEYDQPAVLVIMSLTLPGTVPLPATFKFRIPTGAQLAGVGEVDPQGKFVYNYNNNTGPPPIESGTEWDTVTIQVKQYRSLQIDYYYNPGLPTGAGERSIPVWFEVPLDVNTFLLHIQHPARATDFKIVPDLQASGQGGDGFTYSVASYSDVKAGSTLGHVISYAKPDADLSLNSNGSIATKPAGQADTTKVLLIVILAVVVVVGGIVLWRVFSGGPKQPPKNSRGAGKSGASQTKVAPKGQTAGRNNKAQAGRSTAAKVTAAAPEQYEDLATTASPTASSGVEEENAATSAEVSDAASAQSEGGVEYCVACGEPLVPGKMFCANCGEARSS